MEDALFSRKKERCMRERDPDVCGVREERGREWKVERDQGEPRTVSHGVLRMSRRH